MSYNDNLPPGFQDPLDDPRYERYIQEREFFNESDCCGAKVWNHDRETNLGICSCCQEHCADTCEDEDDFWERVEGERELKEIERMEAYREAIDEERKLGF